jgi:hypothetical protein
MAVESQPPTEAQRSQVPPELRRFAQQHCDDVRAIDRFSEESETFARGWTVKAKTVRPRHLPDGYRLGNVSGSSRGEVTRVQVREVLD